MNSKRIISKKNVCTKDMPSILNSMRYVVFEKCTKTKNMYRVFNKKKHTQHKPNPIPPPNLTHTTLTYKTRRNTHKTKQNKKKHFSHVAVHKQA